MNTSIENEANDKLNPESVAKTLEVGLSHGWLRRLKRLFTWVILVGALSMVAWYSFVRQTAADEAVQYLSEPVVVGNLSLTVTATGNLQPTNQVDVGSELSGIIESVEIEEDQRVTAGQVLALVNTTKLEAQAKQLEAALQAAEAKLLQAQATVAEERSQLARLEHIRELISDQELESGRASCKRAEADEASAAASVSQAQAALDETLTDLSKATIRSPIDGVVLERSIEPGQTVAATFQAPVLFTIAEDLKRMELEVDVDEADVSQVKSGQEAIFTVDAYPDRQFAARITKVSFGSETIDDVVTYEAVLEVRNPELLLRPGMTATTEITTKTIEEALLVPNAALRFSPDENAEQSSSESPSLISRLMPRRPGSDSAPKASAQPAGNEQQVYVVQDSKLVPVRITIGATNGTATEVVEGDLQAGNEVVVDILRGGNS